MICISYDGNMSQFQGEMASPYCTFNHDTVTFQFIAAAVSGAMEGGPGNETSQLASSPVASAQKQDSVIASYKELIKEQVNIFKSQTNILAWSTCIVP